MKKPSIRLRNKMVSEKCEEGCVFGNDGFYFLVANYVVQKSPCQYLIEGATKLEIILRFRIPFYICVGVKTRSDLRTV